MRLSKQDVDKINEEINERKYVLRPKLIEEMKVAREQGDLSENFEYSAAKREKNRNESRIRYLQRLVNTAVILNENHNENQVGVGDTVTILYEDEGVEETYNIVSTFSSDSLNNLISVESPLGRAIVGKNVGDRCLVMVNKQIEYYVNIVKVTKA